MVYPKWKYHPEKEARIVPHAEAEKALGEGWFDSPAHYGIETCPGLQPDPAIAKVREDFLAKQAESFLSEAVSTESAPKKARKAKA